MESLLDGTSSIMKFFIAFVVVFALIAVTAWLIRRFGTGTLGGIGTRGRAPRLAVIEAGAVDGRRKLVLIRRDNTEHLLMIGGPTDIVVEANIVRGQSTRDTASARASSAAETLPRALPAAEETWPLQPEAAPRNGRGTGRPAALDDAAQWALQPEPTVPAAPAATPKRSRSAETLAGLAAELSVRPSEPAVAAPAVKPAPTAETARAKPAPASAAAGSAAADQNLADMASRLEAALRRPGAPAPTPTAAPRPTPTPKPAAEAPRAAPPVAPPPVAAAPPVVPPVAPPTAPEAAPVAAAPAVTVEAEKKPADSKATKQPDDVFGSLEEEMANLLGRPGGNPN